MAKSFPEKCLEHSLWSLLWFVYNERGHQIMTYWNKWTKTEALNYVQVVFSLWRPLSVRWIPINYKKLWIRRLGPNLRSYLQIEYFHNALIFYSISRGIASCDQNKWETAEKFSWIIFWQGKKMNTSSR